MRSTKPTTSASANPLASESIGTRWRTLANLSDALAPTVRVRLSALFSSGNCCSSASYRRRKASYSASEMVGASSW